MSVNKAQTGLSKRLKGHLNFNRLYLQAARINQQADQLGLLNWLGALLSINERKVGFDQKAIDLNQALDKVENLDRAVLTLLFKQSPPSELYQALNETTMTNVSKTAAVLKIETSLDATPSNLSTPTTIQY